MEPGGGGGGCRQYSTWFPRVGSPTCCPWWLLHLDPPMEVCVREYMGLQVISGEVGMSSGCGQVGTVGGLGKDWGGGQRGGGRGTGDD